MANTHSLDLESSSSQYAYITDANQTGLDITGDFTLEAWIKIEQISTNMYIIGKWASGQRSYLMWITSTHNFYVYFSHDGTAFSGRRIPTNLIDDYVGEWLHIAVSADVSQGASGIKIYFNGVLQEMIDAGDSSTSVFNGTAPFVIGANNVGAESFDGKIDEVRVWNDIRTEAEIQNNMRKQLAGNEPNLVGYWKLNNNYLDETSNNNDLTASGSPVFSTDVPFVGGLFKGGLSLMGVGI